MEFDGAFNPTTHLAAKRDMDAAGDLSTARFGCSLPNSWRSASTSRMSQLNLYTINYY